ncbi:trimeric LpxA-like protein [Ascobolus immersus RN42]|uniref:Trimeric LpxA-like protein n=1 Tax=Ascobolus immersus RN42 TaxID=1160509 RepID=A0A3N4I704_ASCIM|nr:trimeric LpxA-like protein [Ascobolus immersus RN42]
MDNNDLVSNSLAGKQTGGDKMIFDLQRENTDPVEQNKRKRSESGDMVAAPNDLVKGTPGSFNGNMRVQDIPSNEPGDISFQDVSVFTTPRTEEEERTMDGLQVQVVQPRKRQFANRTKTGCITCRRRKKKCDEGKPECTNCKRGGFNCEGYTNKVDWSGKSGAAAKSNIVSKQGGPIRASVMAARDSSEITPFPTLQTPDDKVTPRSLDHPSLQRQAFGESEGNSTIAAEEKERSEKDKMLSQQLYYPFAPDLLAERELCKAACWRFNNAATNPNLGISKVEQGRLLLEVLRPGRNWEPAPAVAGGYMADGYSSDLVDVIIEAPFTCSYGYNIRIGKGVHIHMGCTIEDANLVTVKDGALLSPYVRILCAVYPMDPRRRKDAKGNEIAKPVTIKEDCWLGGNVTVIGGVTIGQGAVVGAGSVVTMDIPPFTFAAGNPAGIVRGIYTSGVEL